MGVTEAVGLVGGRGGGEGGIVDRAGGVDADGAEAGEGG